MMSSCSRVGITEGGIDTTPLRVDRPSRMDRPVTSRMPIITAPVTWR